MTVKAWKEICCGFVVVCRDVARLPFWSEKGFCDETGGECLLYPTDVICEGCGSSSTAASVTTSSVTGAGIGHDSKLLTDRIDHKSHNTASVLHAHSIPPFFSAAQLFFSSLMSDLVLDKTLHRPPPSPLKDDKLPPPPPEAADSPFLPPPLPPKSEIDGTLSPNLDIDQGVPILPVLCFSLLM